MELEVLLGGQVAVERRVLEDQADVAAHVVALGGDVVAGDGRGAGRRLRERAEHVDRRRLPGAIGTEEAEDLTRLDGERDAADGLDVPERLAQFVDFDHVTVKVQRLKRMYNAPFSWKDSGSARSDRPATRSPPRRSRCSSSAGYDAVTVADVARRRRRVREDGLQPLPGEGGPGLRPLRGAARPTARRRSACVRRALRSRGSSRPRRCAFLDEIESGELEPDDDRPAARALLAGAARPADVGLGARGGRADRRGHRRRGRSDRRGGRAVARVGAPDRVPGRDEAPDRRRRAGRRGAATCASRPSASTRDWTAAWQATAA